MIHAPEKDSVVNVLLIIYAPESSLDVVSQKRLKSRMTAPLSILPSSCRRGKYEKVDDQEIFKLFLNIAEDAVRDDPTARKVFSMLIQTTLRYRDHVLESNHVVVTVEDVRNALDWLIPSLKTGKLPETDNKIQLDLLKLWLDELRYILKTPLFWIH